MADYSLLTPQFWELDHKRRIYALLSWNPRLAHLLAPSSAS